MSYLSFLTATVTIPIWLLLLMIAAMVPFFVDLVRVWRRWRRGHLPEMQEHQSVLMRLVNIRRSEPSQKDAAAARKSKTDEQKRHMARVLKVMVAHGETGMLLQSIADRAELLTTQVKQAIEYLVDKELIEEVAGISGTKYFLTPRGKDYCAKKGLIKGAKR